MWCRARTRSRRACSRANSTRSSCRIFPKKRAGAGCLTDAKSVEQEFFRRTGIFPTSHAITFHSSYLEKYPSAAQEMFDACLEAKNLALRDDADATYSNFAWNRQVWEEQQAVLGSDPWKFGIKGNEKALEALIRYADEQGLLAKKMTIADLFVQIDDGYDYPSLALGNRKGEGSQSSPRGRGWNYSAWKLKEMDNKLASSWRSSHEHQGHGDHGHDHEGAVGSAHASDQRRHRYRLFDFSFDVFPAVDRLSVRAAAQAHRARTQCHRALADIAHAVQRRLEYRSRAAQRTDRRHIPRSGI